MNNPKSFLEKILDIIDYTDDRNEFINSFMDLCAKYALVDYMNLLSPDRRKVLEKQLLQQKDSTNLQSLLEPYMQTEEYDKLLREHSEKLFQSYLESLMPTLSEEQTTNLKTFFISLQLDQQSTQQAV